MPNFDGGHYFLTVLAPIKGDTIVDDEGRHRSRPNMLRDLLGCLPTAEQGGDLPETKAMSPFARNKRTHLARFVVIDDVVYNGRIPSNAILARLPGAPNLTVPQPVDRLNRPYLFFAADIDTESGDESALDDYLTELWNTMGVELRAIFEHCESFAGKVDSAPEFCAYIKKCQLETTMPFNDYWADGLAAKNPPLKRILLAVLAVLVAGALWLGFGLGSWWVGVLAVVAALVLTLVFAYAFVTIRGGKAFPTAPHSDLKSVLKALYLQQNFVDFVILNQGAADGELYANFADFIAKHRPFDRDEPTQEPGIIRSKI